jgi:hypothetical protein
MKRQIMRAAEHGIDEAGALRHPPHTPHPCIPAVQHFWPAKSNSAGPTCIAAVAGNGLCTISKNYSVQPVATATAIEVKAISPLISRLRPLFYRHSRALSF